MALVATAPAVLESRTDAWLLAPAAGPTATAWLRLPAGSGSLRLVTAHVGDQLVLRDGPRVRTLLDGGCPSSGECQTVRALAPGGDDAFAIATTPDPDARYVMSAAAGRRLRILALDETPVETTARDETRVASAGGGQAVWLAQGAIMTRPLDGSTPARRILRAVNTRGTVLALAIDATTVAWTSRGRDGTYRVTVRPLAGGTGRVLVSEARRNASLGGIALAPDGGVVVARRLGGRRTVDELALVTPGGTPGGVPLLAAASVPKGRPVDLVRPQVSGSIVVARVRAGRDGVQDAIWAIDLVSGSRVRVTIERRVVARLSDPSIDGKRIVWARTRIDGDALVRSRVEASRLRGT